MDIYRYLREQKANLAYHRQMQQRLRSREIIVVHQMGKVGSSAVVASLEGLQLEAPIFHTHYLSSQELGKRLDQVKATDRQLLAGNHLLTSQYLQGVLRRRGDEKTWTVITLVREPIIRNISAFFQNINLYFPDFQQQYQEGSLSLEQLIEGFLEHYPHQLPLQWLEMEIKGVFGVDVFAQGFARERGYQIYDRDNVKLLVLRLEDLNACIQPAFQAFMGVDRIELKRQNIAEDKNYQALYQAFKAAIRLPQSYIDKMYDSQYMRHFYSDAEISAFKQKWEKSPEIMAQLLQNSFNG